MCERVREREEGGGDENEKRSVLQCGAGGAPAREAAQSGPVRGLTRRPSGLNLC